MTHGEQHVYHLALRDLHSQAGAVFGLAQGWSLPMHYGDAEAEHAALRSHAGILDRSHRSRFLVTGTDALDVLRAVFAGHVEDLEEGRAMRTVALDDTGNIRDLVLIARTGGIAYLVTGEAAQRFETLARMESTVQADWDATIGDRTETTCMIGLGGPAAQDFARQHLSEGLPARMDLLHTTTFEFHGFRTLAMRTSDTGEDGFELMVAPAVAQHIIETLRAAGLPLIGMVAQEMARVEACVPAFVPDLEPGLSPAEADLDVLLGIEPGRGGRTLAALLFEGEPVAAGTPIFHGEAAVGEVRSCLRSSGLNATIGLGIVASGHAFPGEELDAKGVTAHVVMKPFLRRRAAP